MVVFRDAPIDLDWWEVKFCERKASKRKHLNSVSNGRKKYAQKVCRGSCQLPSWLRYGDLQHHFGTSRNRSIGGDTIRTGSTNAAPKPMSGQHPTKIKCCPLQKLSDNVANYREQRCSNFQWQFVFVAAADHETPSPSLSRSNCPFLTLFVIFFHIYCYFTRGH